LSNSPNCACEIGCILFNVYYISIKLSLKEKNEPNDPVRICAGRAMSV
jgi:hypothetical protein